MRHFLLSVLAPVPMLTLSTMVCAAPVTDMTKIVLGQSHGCGITRTGALRCFGNNTNGQLGTKQRLHNSFARYSVTVVPAGVTDVAISDSHTCAVVNRALSCWGSNKYGQLGLGKASGNIMTPTRATAVSGVVTSVAAGWGTTCIILAPRGALQCWGRNDHGQVGSGAADPMVLQPFTVIPAGVTAVAIGGQHTCAVVNGGLQCWGFLLFKDDGFKTLRQPISIIPAGRGVTAVAAGLHTCVVVKESLQCWGRNFHNQVGVPEGSRLAPKVPTTIISSGVTAIALNNENTCAVAKGTLLCWGWNHLGQLGIPVSTGSKTPVPLSVPGVPPATIRSVAIGMRQVCVLTGMSADRDASLLQCTHRAPDPEIHDDQASATSKEWQNFGTEAVGLSEPPPMLPRIARYGLWQGTIGTLEVTTLLAPTAQGCGAAYHYKKHLWDIALIEKDRRQGGVWLESPRTVHEATWTFSTLAPNGRSLTGEWRSGDGKRRLPIRLHLVALTPTTEGEHGKPRYDCSIHDKAFNAPRIARARQMRTVNPGDTTFQGADGLYRYRHVSLLEGRVKGFTLPDSRHNPRLQQAMEDWENGSVTEFYGCTSSMSERNRIPPEYSRELAPQFWNARTLVLRESYSIYCGGAYPSGGVSNYLAWDLVADQPINITTWITGTDANSPGRVTLQKLLDLLATRYSRRNETGGCANALEGQEFYLMYPTKTGMVFSPSLPRVIQACAEDIEIPWAEMRPFLSPAGHKALANFDNP